MIYVKFTALRIRLARALEALVVGVRVAEVPFIYRSFIRQCHLERFIPFTAMFLCSN